MGKVTLDDKNLFVEGLGQSNVLEQVSNRTVFLILAKRAEADLEQCGTTLLPSLHAISVTYVPT